MLFLDFIIALTYDLVKEIKGAYDDVQRNKELLKGLFVTTEYVQQSLDQISEFKHRFTHNKSVLESLKTLRSDLEYARNVIRDHGSNSENMLRKFWSKNKTESEIEEAEKRLNLVLHVMQISLGIASAMKTTPRVLMEEKNNWKIDDNDITIKVLPNGNFEEILGYGSFSTVVKGLYKGKKEVAVKVPRNANEIQDNPRYRKMFFRELSTFYTICHTNILKVYGGIENSASGHPSYRIVTEILETDLDEYIKNKDLPLEDQFSIMRGIAEGLSHLHSCAIIHRDLKPKNIMLDKNGVPKIIDFGMSKAIEERFGTTSAFGGTIAYAAPELLQDESCSENTDMYSFGVLGFYVFTGKDPKGTNHDEIRQYYREKVHEDLRFKFIGQCVEIEAKNRISSSTLVLCMQMKMEQADFDRMRFDLMVDNQAPAEMDSVHLSFFGCVEQGDIEKASKIYRKMNKQNIWSKIFSKKRKQVLDKNAKNANGLTVIEVAMEGSHWDMVEWLLDSGFVCKGVGKRVYDDGRYVGGLKDDKPHGRGRYTYADGGVYDGEWRDDKPHGRGRYTCANGDVYDGEWRDGKAHGRGRYTYADGDVYDGEYRDDKRNGQGRFTCANGDVYDGEWRDGKRNGRGRYTSADGDVYDGEYRDGKRNGRGRYTSADGGVYDGEWRDDKPHGRGKCTWTSGEWSGDVYDGEYRDDKRHGRGRYTFADGTIKDGRWENDTFLG